MPSLVKLEATAAPVPLTGHVDSELLLNYDTSIPRDPMVMIVRLTIQGTVLFTVPLIHFPVSQHLMALSPIVLFSRRGKSSP